MNLANIGLTGLLAAQNRLHTSAHNINNVDTPGYSRQSVLVQTAGASNVGAGYVGRGVQAVTIQRSYDAFLFRQLVSAESTGAALQTYHHEVTQVNNLFADRTVGISPALSQFFDGLQAVASEPADAAGRQELLGRAASLVGQFNDASRFLNEQRHNINTQIHTVVSQINSQLERVHELNRQITLAHASSPNHAPNDLYDQRDQAFRELNELVDVRASEQDGRFSLMLGNGQMLLAGDTVYPLQTIPSASDPSRLAVAYTNPISAGQATAIEINESQLKGGALGGLIAYRRDALDTIQNDLGRLAIGLAFAINDQHAQGHTLYGQAGSAFFELDPVAVLPAEGNAAASDSPTIAINDISQLSAHDYRLDFDGSVYRLTALPAGDAVVLDPNDPQHAGLSISLPAAAQAGDSWLIQPTRFAASSLKLAIDDPAAIAAAAPDTGRANGDNALDMAALQTKKIINGGSFNLVEAYSQIVNKVGILSQQNRTALLGQESLIQQNFAAQQRVAGVNLEEEYVNLHRYQDQFRAASRLIDVSATLFDTLLGIRA